MSRTDAQNGLDMVFKEYLYQRKEVSNLPQVSAINNNYLLINLLF